MPLSNSYIPLSPEQYIEEIRVTNFVRGTSIYRAMALGLAPAFLELEPVIEKRVEATHKTASILKKKTSIPKSLAVDRGKGKEADAFKKKKKLVLSMCPRELLLALLLPLQHPRPNLKKGV